MLSPDGKSLYVATFAKIPALKSLAPTQTEPPFKFTQLAVLVLFAALTAAAAVRFRIAAVQQVPAPAAV